MTIEDEVLRLATIAPREPGSLLPLGATDEAILRFEVVQVVPIPREVAAWLRFSDGPNIGPGGINGLRGFEQDFKVHFGFKSRRWLPLGTDGCGNDYVLALDSENLPRRPVYFIDPYASNGYDRPTYAVASGFWQFLRFLLRREMGERRWPFDAAYVLQVDPDLASIQSACLPWVADERSRA